MISIDNAQNEIGLSELIDDGREWADWLLKKADESTLEKTVTKSRDFLTVPRSAVLKKELEQIEQHQNALKAEWQKKFDLLELVYELETYLLTEKRS
ncbi:hypothetical protein ID853_13685 [Xenorhabdus sp. Vera]|uniref:hypothetical protein n=1 Tax=Xenorhabdus koppenhoeferi TaxID=351659 RepID=UPI001997B24D|nr:hypothetical protein [Xenorhabdus sp. Vera]MBD2811911.1 hypothetical protein [Xenorhabdus sp. Vera]